MKSLRVCFAVVALALSGVASASYVDVQWHNSGLLDAGTVHHGSNSYHVLAGRFHGEVIDTDLPPGSFVESAKHLYAYCYDIAQVLSSTSYFDVQPGANAAVLDFLGGVNARLGGDPFAWLQPGSAAVAVAIQFGIWEALYGDDFALGTGSIRTSRANDAAFADVVDWLDQFVDAMETSNPLSSSFVMRLTSPDTQDVITGRLPNFVPEPGSLALLALGAAAAAIARRRPH